MIRVIQTFVQTNRHVACRFSSHFFFKHIIIAKNARYIIQNVIFYEYSHNTITRMIITRMINYLLSTTFRIIFGILHDKISKSNVEELRHNYLLVRMSVRE